MDVQKTSLLAVFDAKQRLEVPLFQRQYVWHEEQQWLPLWEDISRKFSEALEGRANAPVHFLGAMVLDQKQTPTGHVVVRQVIDGQQRLTTFQIFIAAYRDFCRTQECTDLANECQKFLLNTGMMSDPDIDRFKVWPTQLDRDQFRDVIAAESHDQLLAKHPLKRKPYTRKFLPRPRMVEAYFFFYDQLREYFLGDGENEPLGASVPLAARLDECFQTLRNALMVVVIDLQQGDDPQVIFETLNARGEPLLPADLLRNYIFFRANREGLNVEEAYKTYWSGFDDEFWREEVKQGRLVRPRSDLFMQHFLASCQGQDIPIKHLYVEYRHWIERSEPFPDVATELKTLAAQGAYFKRIVAPVVGDPVCELATFLETFDIRTSYPLLLALMGAGVPETEWTKISSIIESYLLRRAVCNFTTKNYNKIFLQLTRQLREKGYSADNLRAALLSQIGESAGWPDDAAFREAWVHKSLYTTLSSPKLVHIYVRLNQTYMSSKSEPVVFAAAPSIEHILPQTWQDHWPLPDGSRGMSMIELFSAEPDDPRAIASRAREAALQTLGNMTILSTGLNSAQSNSGWENKRPQLMAHSLLPINQQLANKDVWDEAAIFMRGEALFERALKIWPRALI